MGAGAHQVFNSQTSSPYFKQIQTNIFILPGKQYKASIPTTSNPNSVFSPNIEDQQEDFQSLLQTIYPHSQPMETKGQPKVCLLANR